MHQFTPVSPILKLNVGGNTENFSVSRQLLCSVPGSELFNVFNGKHELPEVDGKVFIDRNPKIFHMVLDYLRNDRASFTIEDKTTEDLFKFELEYWKLNVPDTLKKLQKIMETEPQSIHENALNKWKELGPLNLSALIADS